MSPVIVKPFHTNDKNECGNGMGVLIPISENISSAMESTDEKNPESLKSDAPPPPKRRKKTTCYNRERRSKKRNKNKMPDFKLGDEPITDILDLSRPLPFKSCKIVLNLTDENDKLRNGWSREGAGFVFYDSITSHEKEYMAVFQYEPRSRRDSRSTRYRKSSEFSVKSETSLGKYPSQIAPKLEGDQEENISNNNTNMEQTRETFQLSTEVADSKSKVQEDIVKFNSSKNTSGENENRKIHEEKAVPGRRIYKCPYCFVPFFAPLDLIKHLRIHRTNLKTQKSESNNSNTASISNGLTDNSEDNCVEIQNGKKLIKCRKCSFSCFSVKHLKIHVKIHDRKGRQVKCPQCPSYFRLAVNMRLHEKYIHKGQKPEGKTSRSVMAGLPKAEISDQNCQQKSAIDSDSDKHKFTETESTNFQLSRQNKTSELRLGSSIQDSVPIQVSESFKTVRETEALSQACFNDEIGIEENIELVHPKSKGKRNGAYMCKLCDKIFQLRYTTIRHIRRIHRKETRFSCTECHKPFFAKSELKGHQQTHLGLKPFQCTRCPKAFARNHNLKTHLLLHLGLKPFKCTQCPKAFSCKDSLRRHLWTHTNRKRSFKCTKCQQAFFNLQYLNSHMLTHNGVKSSHQCNKCSKCYSWAQALKRHLVSHK